MNTLAEIEDTLWPMMADFGLQATLLLGAVVLAYYCCKRLSSARKHALLLAGLLAVPTLLLVSAFPPVLWQLPGTQTRDSDTSISHTIGITPITVETESTISTATPQLATPQEAALAPASPISSKTRWPWQAVAVSIWLAGVAICIFRLGIGWLSLRFATKRIQPLSSPRILKILEHIKKRHPRMPATRLLESNRSTMPMTFGILHPAIVMPRDAGEWDSDRVERVLLHELAHVTRRDCLTNTLALMSGCLLWFHPLTWITWRLLRREQESAADDWALHHTVDPEAYADDLVAIVQAYPNYLGRVGLALSIGMARGNTALKKRLDSLLDGRRDRSRCGRGPILLSLPLGLFAVIALGGLAACKERTSSTKLEASDPQETRTFALSDVQQDRLLVRDEESDPFANTADYPMATDLQDSLQKIKNQISALNIKSPIANISLPDQGSLVITGARSSLAKIEKWLTTVDGTQNIQISISTKMFKAPRDLDVEALLNLGNQLDSDSNVRAGTLPDKVGNALFDSLRTHEQLQFVQVPALSTRAGQLTQFEQIREYIYPTEFDPPELPHRAPASELVKVQEAKAEIARLEILSEVTGERLIEEAEDLGINNATIKTLFPKRLELRTRLAGLERVKGNDDPEVRELEAEMNAIDRELNKGVMAAKNSMNTQIEILRTSIEETTKPQSGTNIVVPSTPSAFETRNTGTMFEFLPSVLPDGRIALELDLEQVRFLGFVDYGTPIRASDSYGSPTEQANKMQQPLFETSTCRTSTTLESGSWVVISGFGANATPDAALDGKSGSQFEWTEDLDDSQFVILIRVTSESDSQNN